MSERVDKGGALPRTASTSERIPDSLYTICA